MKISMAQKQMRRILEMLYDGVCTITEYHIVEDENTFLSQTQEVVIAENIACRLSYRNAPATNQTSSFNSASQQISLYLAPDVKITPGSEIRVVQNDVEAVYRSSGVPKVYATHQEIALEQVDRA